MISLFIVEKSAEGRTRLLDQISRFSSGELQTLPYIPRLNLKSLAPDELRFHSAPHVVVVGEEIVGREVSEVAKIRKLYPHVSIIARVPPTLNTLSFIEQLARFGADEVITSSTTADEFFRKVILLSKNASKNKTGTLVLVDGGKGGVGVTSVAAGLAELCIDAGKTVALVDLDFETQDMSRFFQARPYVNEQLALLLHQTKTVIEETVRQCVTHVWTDDERLVVMPPPPDGDELYDSRSPVSRLFLLVLETLDSMFDVLIVDVGHARGALRRSLYRVADAVCFVVNRDPAVLFSSVSRVTKGVGELSPESLISIVENGSVETGLSSKILKQELYTACSFEEQTVPFITLPDCSSGRVWPGSGTSMYGRGKKSLKKGFIELGTSLGLIESQQKKGFLSKRELLGLKPLPPPVLELPHVIRMQEKVSTSSTMGSVSTLTQAEKLVSGVKIR